MPSNVKELEAQGLIVKKRDLGKRILRAFWGYVFLAPMLVLTVAFVIYPVFASVKMAFYNWDGIGIPTQYVGWRHFMTVSQDIWFWSAFSHTMLYTVVLVPVQLTLAMILALVLNNPQLKGGNLYRALYFMPVVTSAAVVGMVMSLLFGNFATQLCQPLVKLGLIDSAPDILGDPHLALWAVIIVGIWQTLGYNLVYFLAALQSVPKELYEAAHIDGANAVQRFFYVTIPSIRSVGLVILTLAILGSLGVFDLVLTLTGGGPMYASDVVSTYIYSYAFTTNHGTSQANIGYASAASIFMSVVVMTLTIAQILAVRLNKKHKQEA